MTVLANIGCGNMISGLAAGRAAIMARKAVSPDSRVVEHADVPAPCRVAGGAVAAGRRVIAVFAFGLSAIVTAEACAGSEGVIKAGHRPRGGDMTIRALLRRANVRLALANRHIAVVAFEAARDDLAVINVDGFPIRYRVAKSAAGPGLRVINRLSFREAAIMAILTNGWHAFEDAPFMASFTLDCGMATIQLEGRAGVVKILIDLDDPVHVFRSGGRRHDKRKHAAKCREQSCDKTQPDQPLRTAQDLLLANCAAIFFAQPLCAWPTAAARRALVLR